VKNKRIWLSVLGVFLSCSLPGCTGPADQQADDDLVAEEAEHSSADWFSTTPVAEGVWKIDDHGGDNIYLVEGDEKALLIDTGTGVADLAGFVGIPAEKPLLVVNTHGHPDHVGGNFQFREVHAHPLDFPMTRQFSSREYHFETIQRVLDETPQFRSLVLRDGLVFDATELLPIEAGTRFDLGNRSLEVIPVPGHTEGSVCLLDAKNKLLFSGDNNNVLVWLFLDASLPLETYLQSLETLDGRRDEFETIFPGHGEPLDAGFVQEQIACVRNILSGSCVPTPYDSFAGKASQCSYKRATVAFDPEKLFR